MNIIDNLVIGNQMNVEELRVRKEKLLLSVTSPKNRTDKVR